MSEQDPSRGATTPRGERPKERHERTVAEWTTLGISFTILVAVVGSVLFLWRTNEGRAPIITVEANTGEVRRDDSGYVLPIRIHNRGDLTAQDVVITAELSVGGAPPDVAELTIDFLAGGETSEASVVFTRPPTDGNLELRARGFRHP